MSLNRVVHFEIQVDNVERAIKFYTDVFGWKFQEWEGHKYWMIITGEDDKSSNSKYPGINGGLLQRPCPAPAPMQGTNAFVCTMEVANIDEIIQKILDAGGKEAMAKFPLVGMAWQAYYIDTEGNTFGIHQPDEKAGL